jgi:hypothetical protein
MEARIRHRHPGLAWRRPWAFLPWAAFVIALQACAGEAFHLPGWKHSASAWILTTSNGVALPPGARVTGFPLLLRWDKSGFDFATARPQGEDVRFTSATGEPLAFEVEEWDAATGRAAIWVRLPEVRGDDQQEIRVHWGHGTATTASDPASVFGARDGHVGVWHLGADARDAVRGGAVEARNARVVAGVAGRGRRPGEGGMSAGAVLEGHGQGASPSTTEAWVRMGRPNGTVVGWGREAAQGKVVLQVRSPAHARVDAYFSDANVEGTATVASGEWTHLVHVYERGVARLYVNGVLDATRTGRAAPLSIQAPSRLWMGCWHGHDVLDGDLDEVRLASAARSPEWVRLSHGNQKPLQELAGHLVTTGEGWGVTPARVVVREGATATLRATAGGARRVWWTMRRDGKERVVGTGSLEHALEAGRVSGTTELTLVFHAAFADGARSLEVPVTVQEAIPDPEIALEGTGRWDGRRAIEVSARVTNRDALKEAGAPEARFAWKVEGPGATHEANGSTLRLLRGHRGGALHVRVTASNGGDARETSMVIQVKPPQKDAWFERAPAAEELPEDNQLVARDERGQGTVTCSGRVEREGLRVFMRVTAEDGRVREASARSGKSGAYSVSVRIPSGLARHRVEAGTRAGRQEKVFHVATNIVCGDVFLVMGQSNAVATDFGKEDMEWHSPWVRSFGSMSWEPTPARGWGEAVARGRRNEAFQVGYWAMELGRRLVEAEKVPVCFINGAVGGTRIDQHQRSAARPDDPSTLYGRLLWRVRAARLTHGVRGILWHQGENDQGADGPSGGFGWETYRRHFNDMFGAWKRDYPNLRHVHLFQIWPRACAMGVGDSDDRLREVQRRLPEDFDGVHVMSTLGIDPPGGCHYPAAGYAEIARLVFPLVERDHYGRRPSGHVTPPNLRSASFVDVTRKAVVLEFDQPVAWMDGLEKDFRLGQLGAPRVVGGMADGNRVLLRLDGPATASTVSYLDGRSWKPGRVLRGTNGIAALTFCEVQIAGATDQPTGTRRSGP